MKSKIIGIGMLGLLSLSILAPALASVILVPQTTTVTGPCTGTATLNDGSPMGLTTTYVAPCTGTITYQSTTTTTTTTTMNPETIYDIHSAAPSCQRLGLIADVNSFRSNFTASNGAGQDMWQIDYYMTSLAENMVVKLSFTTIKGIHNASQSVYVNGVFDPYHSKNVIVNDSRGIPIKSDITIGQDIDFYTDGDGGQVFWYSAGQTSILFSYNFPNFSNTPLTSFNNEKLVLTPIATTPAQSIIFTNLHVNVQIGEQFAIPQPHQNIPVMAELQSASNPCSLTMLTPPDTNTQQVIVGNKNNNTMVELNIISP